MHASPIQHFLPRERSRSRRGALAAFALAAFALAVLVGSALAANLVKNGSFEKDSNGDGIPNSWIRSNFGGILPTRVCSQSKVGACSLKMVADGNTKELYQVVPISGLAGDEFKLSAWTKAKLLVLDSGIARAFVIFWHTSGGTHDLFTLNISPGTSSWTLRQVSATASASYNSMTIGLQTTASSGKLWFDKLKLVEVP